MKSSSQVCEHVSAGRWEGRLQTVSVAILCGATQRRESEGTKDGYLSRLLWVMVLHDIKPYLLPQLPRQS